VTDELANALEFFIHHEDVRRGAPGWAPRVLDTGEQKAIWNAVRFTARIGLRRLHLPVLLRAPGFGEVQVGGSSSVRSRVVAGRSDGPQATLTAEPSELAMFVSGRQRAAKVDIDAPPETAEALRTAKLNM
jgi:uncharacterized protein (TIGR03085 family)